LRLRELLDEWDNYAETAYNARITGKALGVITGLANVDTAIGGYLAPGLHSLQGGPGVGKTAFALQAAACCDSPALFVTCEMSPLELLRRITARVTGTYLGRFKTGELDPQLAKDLARRAIATCPELSILDCTRAHVPAFSGDSMNLFDIADTIRGAAPHVLVVIDSLHSWACTAAETLTEYESLNAAIVALRALALKLDCPVISIAERNRMSIEKGGLSGGAGTRKIEYSAESVIELDSDGDGKGKLEVDVKLKLSKNRNGEKGRPVNLVFHGALQTFREV